MFRAFKRTKELTVELCERCTKVCDAACRSAEARQQTLLQALRFGARV